MSYNATRSATANHWQEIKQVENVAKKLGWKLSCNQGDFMEEGIIVLKPTNKWANVVHPKKEQIKFFTVAEALGFLDGWAAFLQALKDIEFDIEEYKERQSLLQPIKAIKELK